MKAKYLSMAALALMGALASCQSDDDVTIARPTDAVSVNFSVGSLQAVTRSNALATDDTQRQFNSGDQVCLSTADQDPVTYQYDGEKWNETVAGTFLLWKADQQTFQAYYPTTAGTSLTAFTLPTDQSTVEKINAADYMTGSQTVNKGDEVQMTLNRKMARVIVRISGFGSQYRDDQKTVSNVSIYSQARGIADGNTTGSNTEINPYVQGDGSQGSTYTALVVPGDGDSGSRFIRLTDGEYSTLIVNGIPEMQAGNSYTFNLVVGKNRIEVASVTVTDWTTGETLTGGQATEEGGAAAGIVNPVVGQVIGSDGKNYDVNSLPTGVTKVAMIAYVNGSNGLAIQLSSSPVNKNWAEAKTYAEGLNTSTPIAGGTWRLPSKEDWQNMFLGCAVSGDAGASNYMNPIAGFKAKIAATGTTWKTDYYWSSTPSGGGSAWDVGVNLGGSQAYAHFDDDYTSDSCPVLGCLAF